VIGGRRGIVDAPPALHGITIEEATGAGVSDRSAAVLVAAGNHLRRMARGVSWKRMMHAVPDAPDIELLTAILDRAAARHRHLCPRQVLGARMALAGAAALGLEVPRDDKRLLAITETDGCFVTALEEAAGVRVGARTLRVVDVGKVAVTFADIQTELAVRVSPASGVRATALELADTGETRRWHAMLQGYRRMPTSQLLDVRRVRLSPTAAWLHGRPHVRVSCTSCAEEVVNGREVDGPRGPLCLPCAGTSYYEDVTPQSS